jgi:hypothetical protein
VEALWLCISLAESIRVVVAGQGIITCFEKVKGQKTSPFIAKGKLSQFGQQIEYYTTTLAAYSK